VKDTNGVNVDNLTVEYLESPPVRVILSLLLEVDLPLKAITNRKSRL